MYRIPVVAFAFAVSFCAALAGAHAQVEYGASAAAEVYISGLLEGLDLDENFGGTSASAHAELVGVVADSRVDMDRVSCLTEISGVVDFDALTYTTFFWDTFRVTSRTLAPGTPTTVAFWAELNADLIASSADPTVASEDVVSVMTVGVYRVSLTDGAPGDLDVLEEMFVGNAVLDAAYGLTLSEEFPGGSFTVSELSGGTGYSADLSEFMIYGEIDATVGAEFSLKFSLGTLSSVAPGLTDGTAIADLNNSLRLVEFQTDDAVRLVRASGLFAPPVPLGIAPILAIILPIAAMLRLARRTRISRSVP